MSKIMQISKLQEEASTIPAREIKGQRVVSYKQIAELHQTQEVNLRNNFKNNQSHFIDGIDYFRVKEHSAESKNLLHTRMYFTESGYLMLVKSLTDDLSWKVQRMLVNSYFRANLLEQVLSFLPEQVKKVVYYRGLGLTQTETGKLIGISRDAVQQVEKKLNRVGYRTPNQNGKRSGGWFMPAAINKEQLELAL